MAALAPVTAHAAATPVITTVLGTPTTKATVGKQYSWQASVPSWVTQRTTLHFYASGLPSWLTFNASNGHEQWSYRAFEKLWSNI